MNAVSNLLFSCLGYKLPTILEIFCLKNPLPKIITPNAVHISVVARPILELKMIALEMTNDEIAKSLFISKRTVDTHRQNLLKKLRVKNTAGLIKAAYSFNLL